MDDLEEADAELSRAARRLIDAETELAAAQRAHVAAADKVHRLINERSERLYGKRRRQAD